MTDKKDIREQAKKYYQNQSIGERAQLMQAMVKQVTALDVWKKADQIALTLAQNNELPTQLLIQTALLQKKSVYLPKVAPNHQLSFIRIDESTEYEMHRFGMLEPVGDVLSNVAELELVIVPGLAFSSDGHRVGFGGGYYDRLLAKYPEMETIGLVSRSFFSETTTWETNEFDQPVKQVVVLGE